MDPEPSPPPQLQWTDAQVARFWDVASSTPAQSETYFACQVGRAVTCLLSKLGVLRGRVLDYGCGPGFLMEHLLAAGVTVEGYDFSPASVQQVNTRFQGHPGYRGALAPSPGAPSLPDQAYDLVVCLETIEHVLPHRLDDFLRDLRRLLKPQTGRLFLTTPFAEPLEASMIFCPVCDHRFHRYQHVRTLDDTSLTQLMEQHGYVTQLCRPVHLARLQTSLWPGWADLSLRRSARLAISGTCRALDALGLHGPPGGFWLRQFLGSGPNLFWLGGAKDEKPAARSS